MPQSVEVQKLARRICINDKKTVENLLRLLEVLTDFVEDQLGQVINGSNKYSPSGDGRSASAEVAALYAHLSAAQDSLVAASDLIESFAC